MATYILLVLIKIIIWLKKLNISTGDIKDIYTQEMQHEKDYRYVSLKNYDGKYLYIYKNVNLEASDKKSIEEKLKKYDNIIYNIGY